MHTKNLRTAITSAMIAMCTLTMADDYQYLTVSQTDGERSFAVSSISKITFDATSMVLHLSDGQMTSLPLSGLSKMFFSASSAGIATTGTSKSSIQFSGGVLCAELAEGESVTLYNMKGECLFSTSRSGTYSLPGLARGAYIVKVGTEAHKVVNK